MAVFAEKNVPTIHARVEGAQQVQLSIPVACKSLQVAFLPPNDPETIIVNRSWERTFTSVSEILASSTLPPVRMGMHSGEQSRGQPWHIYSTCHVFWGHLILTSAVFSCY